jgi:cystathionine gamma-lyase
MLTSSLSTMCIEVLLDMRRVAAENQGLETSFLDLESAGEDKILDALRDNTKVPFVKT